MVIAVPSPKADLTTRGRPVTGSLPALTRSCHTLGERSLIDPEPYDRRLPPIIRLWTDLDETRKSPRRTQARRGLYAGSLRVEVRRFELLASTVRLSGEVRTDWHEALPAGTG